MAQRDGQRKSGIRVLKKLGLFRAELLNGGPPAKLFQQCQTVELKRRFLRVQGEGLFNRVQRFREFVARLQCQ